MAQPRTQSGTARRKVKREMICVATIGGEYHRSKGTVQELEPYEIELRFDQEMIDKGVLSVFKNTLAPALMPKQFAGYQGLYTHEIRASYMVDEAGDEWEVEDINLMNRDQLIEYIDNLSNPPCQVNHTVYADAGALRQAVNDWLEAVRIGKTEDFVKGQDKRREKAGADIDLAQRALSLNKVDADPKDLLQKQLLAQFETGSSEPASSQSNSESSLDGAEKESLPVKEPKAKDKADKTLSKI